ncbi:MAG: NADH-quinone oxidoreductase subunit H [Halofilum sp. (in: g-proteobacteria)]|nr:NADH-quinone oxidoreductase subunit H [Halofilum sp. (in: g-proteobacteria)]
MLPTNANRFLFLLAPMLSIGPSLAAWAVIPFDEGWILADIDAGAALRARAHRGRRVRRHHRRLGIELEVRLPRRHALGRADGRLRDRHGLRAGGRADGGRQR